LLEGINDIGGAFGTAYRPPTYSGVSALIEGARSRGADHRRDVSLPANDATCGTRGEARRGEHVHPDERPRGDRCRWRCDPAQSQFLPAYDRAIISIERRRLQGHGRRHRLSVSRDAPVRSSSRNARRIDQRRTSPARTAIIAHANSTTTDVDTEWVA
jgi:hypothetical protein